MDRFAKQLHQEPEGGGAGPPADQHELRNHILRSLPPHDYAAIRPLLTGMLLRNKQVLSSSFEVPANVYFLEGGIISYTLPMPVSGKVEFGITGREGMSNFSALREGRRSPVSVTVQVGGAMAYGIASTDLQRLVDELPALRARCFDYLYDFMNQMAFSALSNARHSLTARLARWLLMCDDRLDGGEVPLTHGFMAAMLGAQRTSVTTTLHVLEGEGAIRSRRGIVHVLDRGLLRAAAGEAYLEPHPHMVDGPRGLPERERRAADDQQMR